MTPTNILNQNGHATTFTGAFSDVSSGGAIQITNADTSGNPLTAGSVTFTGINTYTGATTINTGATLALSGTGSIAQSSGVADSGTFDISLATGNVSIKSLSGSAGSSVNLGGNTLNLSNPTYDLQRHHQRVGWRHRSRWHSNVDGCEHLLWRHDGQRWCYATGDR